MRLQMPYGKEKVSVDIPDENLAGVIEGNEVPARDENKTLRDALLNPIVSKGIGDFLSGPGETVFIVNDATRPTPTARVLDAVFEQATPGNIKFLVATGAHRTPTTDEYRQIFGAYYERFKDRISAHDARKPGETVYIGKSRNGTEMHVNKLAVNAPRLVIISSVEPHYFAGYTGGRKSFLPGVASYKSIEQNHRLALDPRSKALALEGNPVHEDMVDAIATIKNKAIFSIQTVLDNDHRVYAATAGNLDASFRAAIDRANEIFAVKVKEKADIVVTVARFPMDIDLYQSQKALEHGKLALKEDGIIILLSKCRDGIGDRTFVDLLSSCRTPDEVMGKIKGEYVLGYHKAAKMADICLWAKMYGITELPDEVLKSVFMTPFHSLQEALDKALAVQGKDAKVLFFPDGSLTVPLIGKE